MHRTNGSRSSGRMAALEKTNDHPLALVLGLFVLFIPF